MKKNYLLIASIALALLFAGCSKEGNTSGVLGSGEAYMSINLMGSNLPSNRAIMAAPSVKAGEDYLNDAHILYFDDNNLFLGISDKLTHSDFTITSSSCKSNVLEVPGGTKKVFVIVNNFATNGTTARFTLPTKSDIGRPWSAINQTMSFSPVAADGVNEFIAGYIGQQNGQDNFAMANYGVRMDGVNHNTADNGLVAVVTAKDEATAEGQTNTISVDRLASKVEFKVTEKSAGTGEVEALPSGAKFFFQGWEMNATSRKMRLYSEHDSNYKQLNANGAFVSYRKDANYTMDTYGATSSDWAGYKTQFVYLSNVNTDGTGATSAVAKPAAAITYCPENTMTADAQVVGATTKVVVKGNYVPVGYNANDSYFLYSGKYYKLADIQAAYKTAYDAGNTGAIVADMNDFMKAAGLALEADTAAEIAVKVAALTAGNFDASTGIRARDKNAVSYFHEGISYYEVLIGHDSRATGTMELGKYGVVRNNWYTLTLNSVSKPGTPWLPGGPDDPTTPPNIPDDNLAMLQVTIEVNPWVAWSQLVDL